MRRAPFLATLAIAAIACATKAPDKPVQRQAVLCADGQAPCGTGCRPPGTVCCDDGTGKTSSYCEGGGGCFLPGARGCVANGAPSAFCCGATGAKGSVDCVPGQHHCGDACVPLDTPCCSGSACPTMTTNPTVPCGAGDGVVLCGVCVREQVCRGCPGGSCCSGDVCANRCVKGDACVVPAVPTTACNSSADCGNGKVCVSSRDCQVGDGGACLCNGEATGTCVDFSAHNVAVTACGACTGDYNACCPGTSCVDGQCKATCP